MRHLTLLVKRLIACSIAIASTTVTATPSVVTCCVDGDCVELPTEDCFRDLEDDLQRRKESDSTNPIDPFAGGVDLNRCPHTRVPNLGEEYVVLLTVNSCVATAESDLDEKRSRLRFNAMAEFLTCNVQEIVGCDAEGNPILEGETVIFWPVFDTTPFVNDAQSIEPTYDVPAVAALDESMGGTSTPVLIGARHAYEGEVCQ